MKFLRKGSQSAWPTLQQCSWLKEICNSNHMVSAPPPILFLLWDMPGGIWIQGAPWEWVPCYSDLKGMASRWPDQKHPLLTLTITEMETPHFEPFIEISPRKLLFENRNRNCMIYTISRYWQIAWPHKSGYLSLYLRASLKGRIQYDMGRGARS